MGIQTSKNSRAKKETCDGSSTSRSLKDWELYFEKEKFIKTKHLNIKVRYNQICREELEEIQARIVDNTKKFKAIFGLSNHPRKPTLTVYLFNNWENYFRIGNSSDFVASFGFGLAGWGMAQKIPYTVFATKDDIDTLHHEMGHALVYHAIRFKSGFLHVLSEGLAVYFQLFYSEQSRKVSYGHIKYTFNFMVNMKSKVTTYDLRKLLSLRNEDCDDQNLNEYGTGYSIVSYLQEKNPTFFRDMFKDVRKCRSTNIYYGNLINQLHDKHDRAFKVWLYNKYNMLVAEMSSDLRQAAAEGNIYKVKVLIEEGAQVDYGSHEDGWTALHHAASKNYLGIVTLLLENGADVNVESRKGETPLDVAMECRSSDTANFLQSVTEHGFIDALSLLFEAMPCKIQQDELPNELTRAVEEDNIHEIKSAILRDITVLSARTESGWTLLHFAAYLGKTDIANFLIGEGASINAEAADGDTPLHLAIKKDKMNTTEFLMKTISDINNSNEVESCLGASLHVAAESGRFHAAVLLLEMGADIHAVDSSHKGRRPIHTAVNAGHRNIVELFLSRGADCNECSAEYRWTPLHYAALKGHLEVATLLVDLGADVYAADTSDFYRKPIHVAAENGHVSVIELFLNVGLSIHHCTCERWTPLHFAAFGGQVEVAKFLLDWGANIIAEAASETNKPIHIAAQKGHVSVIELFLNLDPPLHFATFGRQSEVAKFIFDTGFDIVAEDDLGHCKPIYIPAQEDHPSFILFPLRKSLSVTELTSKYRMSPLHYAARYGQLHVVEFLVSRGAEVNACDGTYYGRTPIHYAIRNHFKDVVEFLLMKGAGVNELTSKDSWTPLHYAAYYGELEIAKLLVEKDANVNAKETSLLKRKPIHVAAMCGYVKLVELFVNCGVNVDDGLTGKIELTPLHCAACYDQVLVAKFLVKSGADMNAKIKSNDKRKLIHIAAMSGSVRTVKYLVSKGVSINEVSTVNNWTPLHYAAWQGQLQVVILAIDLGANVEHKDDEGCTALDIAIYQKFDDIIKCLKDLLEKKSIPGKH